MKKSKKNKEQKKEIKEPQIIVSELEKELAEKKKENEQLKAVLEEREKLMKKYQELEAKERLMKVQKLKESGALDEPEPIDDEDDSEMDKPTMSLPADAFGVKEQKLTEFEKLLKQFNENNSGTIEIFRIDAGRQIKIGKYPVKDFGVDLDSVARKFGGGEYKLRLRNPDGTFAGEITEYYDEIAYPKPTNTPQYPIIQQSNSPDIATIISQINSQMEKNQMLIMNVMTKIIDSMAQRNNLISSVKDIVEIKDLVAPKKQEENPVKSIEMLIDILLKGIELGKSQSENVGGDDGIFGDLLKIAVSTLKGGQMNKPQLEQVIKQVKEKVNTQSVPEPQVRENPPQITQEVKQQGANNMSDNLIIKMYKPFILQYAKENKNPHDVAVQIFSKIPEQYLPICYDFCNLPTRVDESINFIPELKDYRDWVDKVLSEGKTLIEEYFKEATESE